MSVTTGSAVDRRPRPSSRLARAAVVVLCGAGALVSSAQPPPAEDVRDPFSLEALDLTLDTLDRARLPSGFGSDPEAAAAWLAFDDGKHTRAGELARDMLQRDPESIYGHLVLGLVQHRAEGNLPVALYHLKRGRELFEKRYTALPADDDPWFWHALAITELGFVSGEMGRHRDKIALLRERNELYEPKMPAELGWPLMRLRRYEEARLAALEGLSHDDPGQQAAALTALCAIEAEQQKREDGYRACLAAADHERRYGFGPTPFTNAAEASLGMLRLDEAESFLHEATERFVVGTVSNPWLDLLQLYLAEGRTPEALEAVRRMRRWRHRQPPYMDEQNRAEAEMASAMFLLIAGYPAEAARITDRSLDRPDRTGFTSSESEQMEAAAALLDRLAQRTAAELLAEEASWSSPTDALRLQIRAWKRRLRAWSSGRRAAALLADQRMMLATLRPYLAGAIEVPEWVEPELCAVLGPGIVAAALDRARGAETLEQAAGYFLAWEVEIAFLQGRHHAALELADRAMTALPSSEVLLGARVAARGAQAALEVGQTRRAVELFDLAWQVDPGALRRLGAALPTSFVEPQGELAHKATGYLERSPRFERWSGGGFQIRVEIGDQTGLACLISPQGVRMACPEVRRRAGETATDFARRLAARLHAEAFAPRLDLTQADIRSLDGSPTAGGGRASERLRSVLSELEAGN